MGRVFLHLGWRAYEYVGQCVHALMRTIKNSMPEPLNDEEKRLFEHMHENQSYYGGFPAALLAERMRFLCRAVLAIWDEPQDQKHVGVLHRLLQYFAEMAQRKRAADRQSKQRSDGGGDKSPQGAGTTDGAMDEDADVAVENAAPEDGLPAFQTPSRSQVQLVDNLHASPPADDGPFAEVAEHIRQLCGIECKANCALWEYRRESESEELVTIAVRCECGKVSGKIQMPREEFAKHAVALLGWDRSGADDPSTDSGEPDDES